MAKKLSFISLFSGCGGLDVGFVESGFTCIRAFDIDRSAVDVHRANLGNSAIVADLNMVSKADLLSGGRPDVVIAGSPCQGFSTAGKRRLDDPRNSLLLQAGKLALEIQPKVFIAENVSGALSGDHKVYWENLEMMLSSGGYSIATLKLNASQLGLAQLRSRIFMIAWKGARYPDLSVPSVRPKMLEEVLFGVENLPQHDEFPLAKTSIHYLISQRIKPGQKLCNVRNGDSAVHTWDIPEVFGQTSEAERQILKIIMKIRRTERLRNFGDADPVSIESLRREFGTGASRLVSGLVRKGYIRKVEDRFDLSNTFNGKYRRLKWNAQSLTVDTRFGDPRYFLHPSKHRSFTVREAARIQGFPDWFVFPGRHADSYRMIGNAVAPPMAQHVATIARSLLG